jgi:two-component system, LytTR family, response regulator
MIRALLIDDEKNALTALRKMLEQFCTHVSVVGEAQTALEGLRLIRELTPDVVFLDIEMPGGTGFDLLETIGNRNFTTVFTTAHEQYTIPAIRSGAIDYLLKPVSIDELRAAIGRVQKLIESPTKPAQEPYRLTICNADGTRFVSGDEVICIEGDRRYSRFYLNDGKEYLVSKNLGELEEELRSLNFFRVHKSWLVNRAHVKYISAADGGFVTLSNNKEIEISRRKRGEFLRMMQC